MTYQFLINRVTEVTYGWSVVFKAPGRMDTSNPLTLVAEEYCQLCTKLLTEGRTPINSLLEDQDGIKLAGK